MRVMLVVNEFPPEKIAGTAMATKALAEQLSAKGHKVCVVVTTQCPQNKEIDIAAHDYDLIWLKKRPLRGLGWLWRMAKTLQHAKIFQPDVIQGQAVSCGLIAGLLGRCLNVPSLCYAQGYDVYQASWWQKKTEIRWGCCLPTRCLAVTQHLKQAILDIVDLDVQVMPHAFEMPEVAPRQALRQQFSLQNDVKLVLHVARLEDFKGQDILLKAWVDIVATSPKEKLWIVGKGSLDTALKNMVAELGVQDSVKFWGFLPQAKVHALMQAADLFVLPSREEPFGIVLLEAMAHGLPVVASAVGGIPEVLPDSGDTWQVPPDNNKALADAILEALQDGKYPSLSNQTHSLYFVWNKQVKNFENIYKQLTRR